jgi:hypothetical protein
MRISSAFPSKFLKAADLMGRNITVEIDRVEMDDVGGDDGDKPILYFKGKEKGLVLNKTNAQTISLVYGDDTDDWAGGKLLLFEAQVSFQGKNVAAIRVRIPPVKPAQQQQRQAAPPPAETVVTSGTNDIDDEIPF